MIVTKKFYNKFGKYLLYPIIFVIFLLVVSLLNYSDILSFNASVKFLETIIIIFSFIFGIKIGLHSTQKAYMSGLKRGAFVVLVMFTLNLIFIRKYTFSLLLYYLVIILSTVTGSILGINIKKKS